MSWFARADAHIHAVGCIAGVATYSADPDIPAVKIIAIKGFHVFVHLQVVADVDVDIIVVVRILHDAIAVDVVGDFLYINLTATATTEVVNVLSVPGGRS